MGNVDIMKALDIFMSQVKTCAENIENHCKKLDEKTANAVKKFNIEFSTALLNITVDMNSKYPDVDTLVVVKEVLDIHSENYANFINLKQESNESNN